MNGIVPIENITGLIYLIRGKKVMLDRDLATIYSVETKVFKQAVRRNIDRFPEDFMFELNNSEFIKCRSQFVTYNRDKMGLRYNPKKKIGFAVKEKKVRYGKHGNWQSDSKA